MVLILLFFWFMYMSPCGGAADHRAIASGEVCHYSVSFRPESSKQYNQKESGTGRYVMQSL